MVDIGHPPLYPFILKVGHLFQRLINSNMDVTDGFLSEAKK